MAKLDLDPYDDFDANLDENFKGDVVNDGASFLGNLAMRCYPYDERILWEGEGSS